MIVEFENSRELLFHAFALVGCDVIYVQQAQVILIKTLDLVQTSKVTPHPSLRSKCFFFVCLFLFCFVLAFLFFFLLSNRSEMLQRCRKPSETLAALFLVLICR